MTRQDRIIFNYLKAFVEHRERLPTMKEICADMDMARGQLQRHLKRLASNGHLTTVPRGTIAYRLPHAA